MKKQYINPEMEVVKVDVPQIMAGSPGIGGEYGGELTPQGHFLDDFED